MSRRSAVPPSAPASPASRPLRTLALALACVLLGAVGVAACSPGGSGARLTVEGAYMPRPVTTDTAGGFMVIRNDGDADDELTSVRSDIAADVQIHRAAGGRMQRVPSLTVPAGGELELGRGGHHLMFVDLDRRPAAGEEVPVELRFEESGPVTVDVPVEAANHVPEESGHSHHGEE